MQFVCKSGIEIGKIKLCVWSKKRPALIYGRLAGASLIWFLTKMLIWPEKLVPTMQILIGSIIRSKALKWA